MNTIAEIEKWPAVVIAEPPPGRRSWQSLTVCSVSTTIPPEGGREALAADSLRRVADGAERERERMPQEPNVVRLPREGGREESMRRATVILRSQVNDDLPV